MSAARLPLSRNSSAIFWATTSVCCSSRYRSSVAFFSSSTAFFCSSALTSCSFSRLFSRTSSSQSSATSSRNASTSWGSNPRSSLTANCCCRMSMAESRIPATSFPTGSAEPEGRLPDHRDQERLQEVDRQDHDERREVDARRGQHPTDRAEHRLSDLVEEPYDRVVRIRVHPRDERPDDDDPHVGVEHVVD